jgi:hypothetical protein
MKQLSRNLKEPELRVVICTQNIFMYNKKVKLEKYHMLPGHLSSHAFIKSDH